MTTTLFDIVVRDCYAWIQNAYQMPNNCLATTRGTTVHHFSHDIFRVDTTLPHNKWKNIIGVPNEIAFDDESIAEELRRIIRELPSPSYLYSVLIPLPDQRPSTDDDNSDRLKLVENVMKIHPKIIQENTQAMVLEGPFPVDLEPLQVVSKVQVVTTPDMMKQYVRINKEAYRSVVYAEDLEYYPRIDLMNPNVVRLMAFNQMDEPVACSAAFFNSNTQSAFLFDITVTPSAQGKGLGTYMTRLVMREAQLRNMKYCTMTSVSDAQTIYLKLGFKTVGTIAYMTRLE